jgi:hypothetical protein
MVHANRRKGKSSTGEPCGAAATGDGYCFSHSPLMAERKRKAVALGGRNHGTRRRAERYGSPELAKMGALLTEAIREVHEGSLAPARLAAMANAVNTLVKLRELAVLELEVADLKAKLAGGYGNHNGGGLGDAALDESLS